MLQSTLGLLDSHVGWNGWQAAAHGPADSITIPDAHALFSGDFKRAGVDLVISDREHEFVVRDYFRGEHRPTLLSPDGARLTADVVEALTGHGDYAQAGPAQNAAAPAAVGRVAKVEGSATIIRNGVAITVNTGDAVLKGDVLQTGAGVLGVTFTDGSTLSLTANSRLMVNDFVYVANGSANSEILNLVQGSLSFISGEVAHSGGDMKITTPVATMGIRGTVGGITQANDGTVKFFVVESATGAVLTDSQGRVLFQVVQNGPLIQVRPTGPLTVLAEEIQKSPQELAAELAILQEIVNTQAIGQQILQQILQNNQNPHSTGTDHTQIEIDIPKTAILGNGTGITNSGGAPNSDHTATVKTTDQNGNTTTTEVLLQQQPDPPPASSAITVYWTGAGNDSDPANSTNWDPRTPVPADDVIIGRDRHDDAVPNAIVVASAAFAAHSLALSDGAQLHVDDVTVGGLLALFGNASSATEIAGQSPLTIHSVGGDLFMQATTGDADITACGDLSIGSVAGNLTVEAAAPAGQCASAHAEIVAAGHDLTIGDIGSNFLLSATIVDSGDATAEIVGGSVRIGNVGQDFTVTGSPDCSSSTFAEISATSGDLTIGNIVGDFLNQGLIDADNGVLSIGTVGGTFVNDGVMRAYELQIAANDSGALDNHGKIIVSGGGGGDDVGTVGVDLHNDGLFKVTDGALLDFNGSVHNDDSGTIVVTNCSGVAFDDPVFNSGLIKASHDGEIDFDAGIHNFGTIEAASGGSIHFGDGSVDNCGIIEANSGGTVDFSHWVGGNGTLAMDGGTVELASGTCNTIDFSGTCGGNLVLDCATAPIGQITNFGPDDSIDLFHLNDVSIVGYTADSCNTGTLELYSCTIGDFSLSFTGDGTNYSVDNFVLSSDGNCGTQITEAPAIDVLNQIVNTDSVTNVTTVTDFKIVEPFDADEPLTITAVATHDATLVFGSEPASGTISETATLSEINDVLHNGIVYTPGSCTPDVDSISLRIASDHGSETLNLMFKVAQTPGGVTLTATSGNDVMYGTESCDNFVFDNSHSGHDVVANFDTSHDTLEFNDSIFDSIQAVLDSAHDDIHGNAVITTAQNSTVTLDHVCTAQLNASNVAILHA